MSKIGKKPIQIPQGVDIKVNDSCVSVKGPKGELKIDVHPTIRMSLDGGLLKINPRSEVSFDKEINSVWGLVRAIVANAIRGVVDGFEKALEFEGVGYKANVKGDQLELSLGYSHPITIKAPEGINFKVEKNMIKVIGIDKNLVGHIAAKIKSKRLPEPYKGSGIRYAGEVIKRKAGKKAATAA